VEALQNQKIHRRAPEAIHGAEEPRAAGLPSREEVMAFIGGAPARVTNRDIARAFGVKGEAKAELKLLIKDLQAAGAIARGRKALTCPGPPALAHRRRCHGTRPRR
jgi:ribonuclease R